MIKMIKKIGLKVIDGVSYYYPMVIIHGKRIYGGTYETEQDAKEWIAEILNKMQ